MNSMTWPADSPDLNAQPENLWWKLKQNRPCQRSIHKTDPLYKNRFSLVKSMSQRIQVQQSTNCDFFFLLIHDSHNFFTHHWVIPSFLLYLS